MVGDNQIDTRLDVRSHVENNSINDSVFYSSSISLDVVCGCGLIFVIILTEKCEEDSTTGKRVRHHFEIVEEAERSESGVSVLRNFKVILEKQYVRYFLGFLWEKV